MGEQEGEVNLSSTVPLVLHRIVQGEPESWEDVTLENLQRIIAEIGCRGSTFCPHQQAASPDWLLTFDDGFVSDYDMVFPALLESGGSASFFVIIDQVGKPGYMDWEQIVEMQRYGMCFGSHSISHRRLTELSINESWGELSESKSRLEDRLGAEVTCFSFPFGAWSNMLIEQASKAGYSRVCTSEHGVVKADRYIFPRNSIHGRMDWKTIWNTMYPTEGLKLRWKAEDFSKSTLKFLLGNNGYKRLRDGISRNR